MAFEKINEAKDTYKTEKNDFKEIKPQNGMTFDRAKEFVSNFIEKAREAVNETKDQIELKKECSEYQKELKNYSEVEDTLPNKSFDVGDLKKVSPEENRVLRDEFSNKKNELKAQWEEVNGRSWPKYSEDVYITLKSGETKCIRKAGMDYDAHHIQPLGLGGKNDISNITPLHADIHYDSRGIHAKDSAYSKIVNLLEDNNKI